MTGSNGCELRRDMDLKKGYPRQRRLPARYILNRGLLAATRSAAFREPMVACRSGMDQAERDKRSDFPRAQTHAPPAAPVATQN